MAASRGRAKGRARELAPAAASRPAPSPRAGSVVALTGVNTFLGQSLVALLERSPRWRRIVAIDLKNAEVSGPKTRFYRVDLAQPAVDAQIAEILHAEKVDTVVHGAFLAMPSHAAARAHELESVGTMHVLGACEESGVRKLVVWSQTLLYGARSDNPMYIDESHALGGNRQWSFVADKLDAEEQVAAHAARQRGQVVTVLRTALTVGPSAGNMVTDMLRFRAVPTVLGFDPLVQLVHELDVVAAFRTAVDEDHPGVFNVVAPGVLPLSSIVRLAGRLDVPMPQVAAAKLLKLLFFSRVGRVPEQALEYLRYPFVASGERAAAEMGFRACYTTREALADFVRARRQRRAAAPEGSA